MHVLCGKAQALRHANPKKQKVNDFNARILQIVKLESPALLRLTAPVLPEGAIPKLLELI